MTGKHTDIPPGKKVTINDNEEVVVGMDTNENYFMAPPQAISDSAFKCSPCSTVTIHSGFEVAAMPWSVVVKAEVIKPKRVYMCTNCGKFSSK